MKKKICLLLTTALLFSVVLVLTACNKATTGKTTLELAHGQVPTSEVAQIVALLKDKLAENPDFGLEMVIHDSGVLGTERQLVELVKSGVIDMAKVAASSLDAFVPYYGIFALPYLFQSEEHYYRAMSESDAVRGIFESSRNDGFFALNYHPSGARNVYLVADTPASGPSVLRGKKLRVMESPTAIRMIELMGGTPVPMSTGEVYTALQQGVLDGAENTEMVLNVNRHGEIVKAYTYTEHQYLPDIFIINTKTWEKLSEKQQQFLRDALAENSDFYKASYKAMIAEAVGEGRAMGVNFYTIDKNEFIESVQPMHQELRARGSEFAAFYDDIQNYK